MNDPRNWSEANFLDQFEVSTEPEQITYFDLHSRRNYHPRSNNVNFPNKFKANNPSLNSNNK